MRLLLRRQRAATRAIGNQKSLPIVAGTDADRHILAEIVEYFIFTRPDR